MDQEEVKTGPDLSGWLRRATAHRRSFVLCVFTGWVFIVGAAWVLPSRYRSETLILVEQQKVPEHYVEPNITVDLQQRLQSMSEQILSRTRLMGIAEKFHLYSADQQHLGTQAIVERMRKDIGIDLVRSNGDQITAFKVSYSANDAAIAQQVTAELTSLFIEENLQSRQQLSEDTTSFLETQLDAARKNLEQQELRLREFKSRYLGQLPEQTASNMQILAGLQTRLQSANDALNQAEQQRLYLQSLLTQYRGAQPSRTGDQENSSYVRTPSATAQKIEQLKTQLTELRAKYTSRHPDVIRVEQELAEEEKNASAETSKGAPSSVSPSTNTANETQGAGPILQIESQLKGVDFQIGNRKAEIKGIENEIDSYQKRLNLAPAREQELAAITRDHEQSRAYYESLLAKRNQSEMATNLEKRQQGEQFRMIDPPSLPQRPYFPNRLLFSLGGIAFGLVLACGNIVGRELIQGQIYGEEELKAVISAANVVLIPGVRTAAEINQMKRSVFADLAIATAVVVVIPAATLLLYYKA